MPSDVEIAQSAEPRPIEEVAADLGLSREALRPFGADVAKLPLSLLEAPSPRRRPGRLILVSAITPTPAGEGKTTTSIGLAQGLAEAEIDDAVGQGAAAVVQLGEGHDIVVVGLDLAIGQFVDAQTLDWLAGAFYPGRWLYNVVYAVMVVFFAYFYTAITFNPEDVAENLKKQGGYIPRVRPGKETAAYIDWTLTRLTAGGQEPTMALRNGIMFGLCAYGLALIFLWISSRTVVDEEDSRMERARAAGEPV